MGMLILKILSSQKPREIAARILQRRQEGDFVEHLLDQALATERLSPPDRHLCQELVYGSVRWQATLDWLIARKTGHREQKSFLQNLLRLGLYQLFWLDRIPAHAAVNETVEIARQAGFGPQSGFVNAVLRGYVREADATRKLLQDLKLTDPATGFSHPGWLVERWVQRWGSEATTRLLQWNNTPPPTFARVNTLKIDAGRLLDQWREENVVYDFVRAAWLEENQVFKLKEHPPLTRLRSFLDGLFYIQDPSTLLAVNELDPQPGGRVLDLCAAPGGKLAYIGQRMQNKGVVAGHDPSPDRLKLVEENCRRLGVTCAHVVTSLANLKFPGSQPFDRILIDAPCSNTGVIRRRVDLRWHIRLEEFDRLRRTQLALLHDATAFLAPSGTIVYSTCSLEAEENSGVIQEFLARNPGWTLAGEKELRPFADGVDGAYVAKLVRAT
jgi:16S rRNA (cytosine967-C5)-methyltransferase